MSNLATHEAEQAAITAACEAGVCQHPDCHQTPCERAQAIMDETDNEPDNNARRAARIALAILPAYDNDTADQGIRDAVSDLLHLCDLMGLDFADLEADARGNYLREVQDLGPATDEPLRLAIERN